MFLTKLKIAAAVLVAVVILGTGTGWLLQPAFADKPTDKPVKKADQKDQTEVHGVLKTIDVAQKTIRVQFGKGSAEETLALAGNAQVLLDDGTGDKLGFQEGKLANLTEGTHVTLRLTADQKVTRIWVDGPTVQGTLNTVDAKNHTITATVTKTKTEPAADKTFTVARNVKLFIDDGKAADKSQPAKEFSLADLPANATIFLKLSADRKVVGTIRAEGQTLTGLVKTVDADKNTLTITIAAKGEPTVERTLAVAKTAQVEIDDGKKKDKTKPAVARSLADLPIGAQVTLRLSLDQLSVVAIRAVGANVHGTVKAVDVAQNTLTLHDKQIEEGRTYSALPDAQVFLDGKSEVKTLADLPVGAVVDLKLLAGQKSASEIRAFGPTVMGRVVGNADKDSITLHGKEGDKTFALSKDTRIVIDEKKEGKLTDLIDGTVARLRLSTDKAAVLDLYAEGPSFHGKVKAVDPDKFTITLTIGSKDDVEDKDFKLTKETIVLTEINNAPFKLTDLRVDKEVVLRLSIDQKVATRLRIRNE